MFIPHLLSRNVARLKRTGHTSTLPNHRDGAHISRHKGVAARERGWRV